jgi:pyruvate/2-oxoglutarate dehydrogenase complex dihydrolipoamide acyltransferase (E2) component
VSSAGSESARAAIVVPDVQSGGLPIRFVQWLVEPETYIHAGDRVAELLVSGVLFHVESPADGTFVEPGQSTRAEVSVGEVLGWVDVDSPDTTSD